MNNKPFKYLAHCGTSFECSKCDLSAPIYYEQFSSSPSAISFLMCDAAEMAGYHTVNIRSELNGFQGYDYLEFKEVGEK